MFDYQFNPQPSFLIIDLLYDLKSSVTDCILWIFFLFRSSLSLLKSSSIKIHKLRTSLWNIYLSRSYCFYVRKSEAITSNIKRHQLFVIHCLKHIDVFLDFRQIIANGNFSKFAEIFSNHILLIFVWSQPHHIAFYARSLWMISFP